MTHAVEFLDARVAPGADALDFAVRDGSVTVLVRARRSADVAIPLAAGLVPPHSGRVLTLGEEPARMRRGALNRLRHRLGVAMVPGGLLSNQSLRTNVIVPLLFTGVPPREARRAADETLEACGLTPWAAARPNDVADEVRQTAVIARALARRPELLLLEDPFSGLDPETEEVLLGHCRRMARTILVTTHRDDAVLLHYADAVEH